MQALPFVLTLLLGIQAMASNYDGLYNAYKLFKYKVRVKGKTVF